MKTFVATAGSSVRPSVARAFPRVCLIAFPAAAILLAQAATVAIAIDVNLSTGNLSYNDGQGHTMPYRLYVPPGYNTPGAKFPLILFLHGSGESGTNNTSPSTNGHIDNLYNAAHGNYGAQYDAFLLVPQTLSSVGWEDYGPEYPQYYGQVLAMDILNQVTSTYQVDASRLYVTGLSMGGGGTFDIISHYPHEFAAASPLSGWGDTSMAPVLKDIPIWAYHGAADTTVSVTYTDEMVAAIQAAGGSLIEYTRPAGVGHSGWETFYNNTTYKNSKGQTFDQWMFAQVLPTPEPGTLVLLGAGAIIVAAYSWRRRRLGVLTTAFGKEPK
jgi:predicted peptidase